MAEMDMTQAVQGLVNLFVNMDGTSRLMFIRLLVTQMKDDEVDLNLQVIQFRQKAECGNSTSPDVSKFLNIELKQEPIEHDADSYFQSDDYKNILEDEKMREEEEYSGGLSKIDKPKKLKIKLGLPKEKKFYYCDQCDKQCQKRSDLVNHVKTVHEGLSFDCLECEYKATKKWNLKAHVDVVHRGKGKTDDEKRFVCEKCCKKFGKQSQLLQHLKIHEDKGMVVEKRFFCEQCSKTFTQKFDLTRHIESVHEGIRLSCDQCEYTAARKWHLQQHIDSTHKGIVYPCGHCGYEAKSKQTLQRHVQAIHDGVRYPCEYCGYQASQPHVLKKHIQETHIYPNLKLQDTKGEPQATNNDFKY